MDIIQLYWTEIWVFFSVSLLHFCFVFSWIRCYIHSFIVRRTAHFLPPITNRFILLSGFFASIFFSFIFFLSFVVFILASFRSQMNLINRLLFLTINMSLISIYIYQCHRIFIHFNTTQIYAMPNTCCDFFFIFEVCIKRWRNADVNRIYVVDQWRFIEKMWPISFSK